MSAMKTRLIKRFRDKQYRGVYVNSFLNTRIAAQIRALREARGMSQADLAKFIGTTQSGVSALENVNYSSWSLRTLRKLAEAFDVALVVKFESFGSAVDEITAFNEESLAPVSFSEDPAFQEGGEESTSVGSQARLVS